MAHSSVLNAVWSNFTLKMLSMISVLFLVAYWFYYLKWQKALQTQGKHNIKSEKMIVIKKQPLNPYVNIKSTNAKWMFIGFQQLESNILIRMYQQYPKWTIKLNRSENKNVKASGFYLFTAPIAINDLITIEGSKKN